MISLAEVTVVYGPMGSGKTHNKERLQRFFQCGTVVDDWRPTADAKFQPYDNTMLILTQANENDIQIAFPNARIVSISDALRAIEVGRRAPLSLPSMPNFQAAMKRANADAVWSLIGPAAVLAISEGIKAFNAMDPDSDAIETRIATAVDSAAAKFVALAELHGIGEL